MFKQCVRVCARAHVRDYICALKEVAVEKC